MREKASIIYQKLLKDEQTISDIDLYNEDINKIIEIISNECKSTVVNTKGETKSYESLLKKSDVKELIIQFLKNSHTINSKAVRDVMTTYYIPNEYKPKNKDEIKILGPTLDLPLIKKMSQDGKEIEKIEIKNLIADDIGECIIGKDTEQLDEIKQLVLEPFVENLINNNN